MNLRIISFVYPLIFVILFSLLSFTSNIRIQLNGTQHSTLKKCSESYGIRKKKNNNNNQIIIQFDPLIYQFGVFNIFRTQEASPILNVTQNTLRARIQNCSTIKQLKWRLFFECTIQKVTFIKSMTCAIPIVNFNNSLCFKKPESKKRYKKLWRRIKTF